MVRVGVGHDNYDRDPAHRRAYRFDWPTDRTVLGVRLTQAAGSQCDSRNWQCQWLIDDRMYRRRTVKGRRVIVDHHRAWVNDHRVPDRESDSIFRVIQVNQHCRQPGLGYRGPWLGLGLPAKFKFQVPHCRGGAASRTCLTLRAGQQTMAEIGEPVWAAPLLQEQSIEI